MFWTKEKLEARIKELKAFRYRDAILLTGLRMKIDGEGANGEYPTEEGEWTPVRLGHRWQGRDVYRWLAVDALLPAEWAGRSVLARFDLGATGGGNNSGFESLLFLNGSPYQGVDANHDEVFLPEELLGKQVSLRLRLWSGMGGYEPDAILEHRLGRAELAWLDEATDDLYFTSRAVLETSILMQDAQPEKHELLAALDRSFHRLDWSRPGSEVFYESVQEARGQLRAELARLPKHHPVEVQCIGHTHIDVAWLWRLTHTREKAARSFSTALRLMEQYPDYVFLQTMPQLYAYIKKDYPELYEQIRERVKEGRWEAGGAMWLEADCNLASGESLVRQLLYGIRFFREEFGTECSYLWLPDVFGYSWAMPQLLRKCGIKTFMTTKISWNQYNRMPHDTFIWRGIDGTEIVTHFITTPSPGAKEGTFFYTYNGGITPYSIQGIWEAYRDKAVNRKLLLAYGHGDGGGGVTREMLELRRRIADMPGLPQVTTGRADAYFEQLKEELEATDQYVHTWDGELYLELHRGTYTSQAYNKRMNRQLELALREAEWLNVVAAARGDWQVYAGKALHDAWIIVLRNQFHDIIPGSAIREVYEDCRLEYAEAGQLIDGARRQAELSLMAGDAEAEANHGDAAVTVLNSASWTRSDLVHIASAGAEGDGEWRDANGARLRSQRSADGQWLVETRDVPSLGWSVIRFASRSGTRTPGPSGDVGDAPFHWSGNGLCTPHYELAWNDAGQLTRIYDREAARPVLSPKSCGNVFQVFEDKPKSRHEAWDIDLFYQQKMREMTDFKGAELMEVGELRAVVRFRWGYMDSVLEQDMIVYSGSRRIDYATRVDWHEQRQLLKVAFPVDIRAVEATYDIQFGNIKRSTHWNTSWDYARFESVGHQWADLSERDYGVSLLNDCKYGYDIKDGVMRLTLIKSALVPDATADQGEHLFTYSLLPHAGDWLQGSTAREAWDVNNPLSCLAGEAAQPSFSLIDLSAEHVVVDAIKKAEDEDAIIVRLHEFAGCRGRVELDCGMRLDSWQECDLLENPEGELHTEQTISFDIKPYEIKTFLIRV
ncbi:alpha-mannosidase [Paenibacillus sp. MY03]|uniref:alpha-mannosidase n=1 Tax=Paenibacillus sp. MY03 TaxID=302980 RepID=UPI000B3C8A59|nr:alpha-mannosidase [Paenibacillus sp. MY03]OUS67635.1 alpha-mannosidase [Paenibacillus sp. MY03]